MGLSMAVKHACHGQWTGDREREPPHYVQYRAKGYRRHSVRGRAEDLGVPEHNMESASKSHSKQL